MTKTKEFENKVKELIDDLKSVCANYGLGNDGMSLRLLRKYFCTSS